MLPEDTCCGHVGGGEGAVLGLGRGPDPPPAEQQDHAQVVAAGL